MSEQLLILLSLVYAIALTHIFSSITNLILARDRVKVWGPHVVWMAFVLVLLFYDWLELNHLKDIKTWSLLQEVLEFSYAALIYFTASLVSIRVEAEGPIDMQALHLKQRPAFLASSAALVLIVMIVIYRSRWEEGNPDWFIHMLMNLPFLFLFALARVANARWLQWLASLATLALVLAFVLLYPPG